MFTGLLYNKEYIKDIVEYLDEEIQGKVCEKQCGVFHALLGYTTLRGPFMCSSSVDADVRETPARIGSTLLWTTNFFSTV